MQLRDLRPGRNGNQDAVRQRQRDEPAKPAQEASRRALEERGLVERQRLAPCEEPFEIVRLQQMADSRQHEADHQRPQRRSHGHREDRHVEHEPADKERHYCGAECRRGENVQECDDAGADRRGSALRSGRVPEPEHAASIA